MPTDGTGKLRIVGKNLWTSTIPTRVTIGGQSGGVVIDVASVVLGNLTLQNVTARRLAQIPADEFIDITIPPWQGSNIPVVVFKLLSGAADGPTAGSQAVFISFAAPTAVSANGTNGLVTSQLLPVTARANGTSTIRLTGTNFGTRFTFLEVCGLPSA